MMFRGTKRRPVDESQCFQLPYQGFLQGLTVVLTCLLAISLVPASALATEGSANAETGVNDAEAVARFYDSLHLPDGMQLNAVVPAGFVGGAGALYTTPRDGSTVYNASLPDEYDLRDVDGKSYVTPVKSQNPWSTCWAFATDAALESSMLMQGVAADEVDLSGALSVVFPSRSRKRADAGAVRRVVSSRRRHVLRGCRRLRRRRQRRGSRELHSVDERFGKGIGGAVSK